MKHFDFVIGNSVQSKHELKGKDDLLRLIRRNVEGLPVVDVKDSYTSVMDDLMVHFFFNPKPQYLVGYINLFFLAIT
jgi:hypothetical protein